MGREERLLRLGASRQKHDHLKHQVNFRKSTPPQKRQLIVLIGNGKQQVDDFVAELTR